VIVDPASKACIHANCLPALGSRTRRKETKCLLVSFNNHGNIQQCFRIIVHLFIGQFLLKKLEFGFDLSDSEHPLNDTDFHCDFNAWIVEVPAFAFTSFKFNLGIVKCFGEHSRGSVFNSILHLAISLRN